MSAVQNTTSQSPQDSGDGPYEMKGPGVDISSLMGGIMMPHLHL